MHTLGSALVLAGIVLWGAVPLVLAARGRMLYGWVEWCLWTSLPLVLAGVLIAG